jgi:enoyl-CoA hydratase
MAEHLRSAPAHEEPLLGRSNSSEGDSPAGSDAGEKEGEGVVVERVDEGRIVVVGLNRPQYRNAVDGPTAAALTRALRQELEADPVAKVGVLHGIGGSFCAGADLKAVAADHQLDDGEQGSTTTTTTKEGGERKSRRNRLLPHGDGPMGPTRLLLSKPVIAAVSGTTRPAGYIHVCVCVYLF